MIEHDLHDRAIVSLAANQDLAAFLTGMTLDVREQLMIQDVATETGSARALDLVRRLQVIESIVEELSDAGEAAKERMEQTQR